MNIDFQKHWAEQDARNAKLIEKMRKECADAIASLAQAIHSPRSPRADLEEAHIKIARALSIAVVLDPEA